MTTIHYILLCLSANVSYSFLLDMPSDEAILTYDMLIDKNDDFLIDQPPQQFNQDFAYTQGIWSRYNPLTQITQIGRIGIFDSSCYNLLNVMKKKEKNINFLYYDCLDKENQQITKNIRFRDNNGLDHFYTIQIDPTQYESNWYFFQLITWPHLEKVRLFITHQADQIYFQEVDIKFPYFERNLTLNLGGGADGFYFSEQIQYSYFPGSLVAEFPQYRELDPLGAQYWIEIENSKCFLPNDLSILNYSSYEKTDIAYFSTQNQNTNYFLLVGWIKIIQIIQVDKEFTYKLLKLTTQSRNSRLTDDNLSPFCLYYFISELSNQIIFTTYSYSFPSVNVDFITNPYLIRETIDIQSNILVWQYLTVELSNNIIQVTIIFYDELHSTYKREVSVIQFQDVIFQLQIGNILQRKDNYLNFIASQFKFSNCDSVIFFQHCHSSCLECDGPTNSDCLSCSLESKRFYIPQVKQCACSYNTVDKTTCLTQQDLNFNIIQGNQFQNQTTCPFGYFMNTYGECFQCPSIISSSQITCLECVNNPNDWIKSLYCSTSLVSYNGAAFTLIEESKLYYIFDENGLKYCQDCQETCLDQNCIYKNFNSINLSNILLCISPDNPFCYKCNIEDCVECGLSEGQQFICLKCPLFYAYQDGKCILKFVMLSICFDNCASCSNEKQCSFCYLPYFVNTKKDKCILCNIPNCHYCFEYQINDRSMSTLYKDFQPFDFDENTRIGCSLCYEGFNFDFQLEKCVQSIPKITNCLRSYIEFTGQEICLLSSINDFNVAPQIINCQQLINNCEQCLLTPAQLMQCILCEKGYSASYITGQCHTCDALNSEYCIDGSNKRDYWVQLIQSFLIQFLPDNYMYGFKGTAYTYVSDPLTCVQGYRLSRKNQCVKDCDTDCVSCVEQSTDGLFLCEQCPINYYGYTQRSATQRGCLICPQLCLYCIERSADQIAVIITINLDDQSDVYCYQLESIKDEKIIIDTISLVAKYCFNDDCNGVFEYKTYNNYNENTIDIDYCNRMGIKTFQLTVQLINNIFDSLIENGIFLKQKIFSLEKIIFYYLGNIQYGATVSSAFSVQGFDFVKWQNITFIAETGMTISLLNYGLSVDLTLINLIFTGSSQNNSFFQNENYKDLRIQNVTLKDLHLKDITWLEYQTKNTQTSIHIDQLTIQNCVFQNVTLFSILSITGSIQLNSISIITSQFVNTTLLNYNQTSQFKGIIKINDFLIDDCIIQSSNVIVQINSYSLQINNMQLFNSQIIESIIILTGSDAIIQQLQIDLMEFLISSFFQVIIESSGSKLMNYQFSNFSITRSHFTESRIAYIHSINTEGNQINIFLTTIQHSQLNSTSISDIIFLYDFKCQELYIQDIKIQNSFNVSYFSIYQTNSIQVTDIIQKNLNQEYKIKATQECNQKIKLISILLRIQGFQQIHINNFQISNQYSIDYSLIQIDQDQLFYKNGEGTVDIYSLKFFGNILIKVSLGNIFSLLGIYSDFSQKIHLKDLFFQENFFNQQIDDPSKSAAGLIYINTQLSEIKIESIECIQNGLTNSSYSFMMINSLTQIYNNISVQNSNYLSESIWNQYYQVQLEPSTNTSNIFTKLIYQLFTISNIGGVCQIIASKVFVENATFSNIQAYSRAIFDITTQGQGIVILSNMKITNISTALQQSNSVEGCITISSQNSDLYLNATNLLFIQVYNRLDSAIFTIFPSKKQNLIALNNVEAIDSYSLMNQFIFVQFSKESQSQLYIRKLVIKNNKEGLKHFLRQILFPSSPEISKIKSDNALIQVENGNIYFNDLFITGMFISQIILLSDQKYGEIVGLSIMSVQVLYPLNLIKFSYLTDMNSTLLIQNVKITNSSLILSENIGQQNNMISENLLITFDQKYCLFSIQKSEQNIISSSINDLSISLNIQKTLIGSLIAIIGQSMSAQGKVNNIQLYNNICNFCYDGLIIISQNQATIMVIQEFKCFGNTIKQYGCINLQTGNSISNLFTIKNSVFLNNNGQLGVGISSLKMLMKVQNSLFSKNYASEKGGALYMENITNDFVISKCLIFENSAPIGGGIYLAGSGYLTQENFDKSITQFNTANLYSNNLVEAPDHLALKINNVQMKSFISEDQNMDKFNLQIASIQPYQLLKERNQYTTSLYLPSGQQIKDYELYDIKNRIFKKYISEFSLVWKNSMGEDLIGFGEDQCQIFITSSNNKLNETHGIIGNTFFNIQSNYFDLIELKVSLNPYINSILNITLNCTSSIQSNQLGYQINAKTFDCQQGEFFTNNECKICEPIYGFYSVTVNATQCSIFDANKFLDITKNQIKLKGGYWRPRFTSNIVELCLKKLDYCIGGWGIGNDLCYPGYIGGLCEECDIYNIGGYGNYAKSGTNSCNICTDSSFQYISPVFLIIWSYISLLLSLKSNRQTSKTFARLRATTGLYEILFRLSQGNFNQLLDFESILLKMFFNYLWNFSVIFTFNISFDFSFKAVDSVSTPSASVATNLDCLLTNIPNTEIIYLRIIFMITFILSQIFIVSGGIKIYSIITKTHFELSFITNIFLYLFVTNQATLIKNLSSLIAIRTISEEQFIQGNVSMLFYNEDHLLWVFTFILPCLLIIGVILPFILFCILFCNKNQSNQVYFRKHFGYLFNEYNQQNQFWEQVRILVRTTIIIFLTSFETSIQLKACLISLTILIYSILAQNRKPYTLNNLNLLDISSGQIVLISIFLALIKYICEQNLNLVPSNILQVIISILLIILCMSFIVRIVSIYEKKYSLFVLRLLNQLCKSYCKIGYIIIFNKN